MPLINHPTGNYSFLPGIAPYSCGVISAPGHEIIHATFHRPCEVAAGFERVAAHLESEGRPRTALCAIELRSPEPFTFEGFAEFNTGYRQLLEPWGVFVDGVNPIARTNVAPVVSPPREPLLHGFSYTRATGSTAPPTFVVAGAGELPEGRLAADDIVAAADVSPQGLDSKAAFVLDLMRCRLHGLGANWSQVTVADVYTIHSLRKVLQERIAPALADPGTAVVNWYFSRPPIHGIEFEMDVRGVRSELRINY